MYARRLFALAGLIVALVVLAPGQAVAAKGGTDRPMKGSETGTSTFNLATLTGTSHGTGIYSHLGKVSYTADYAVTITGPTTVAISGSVTLVAANGDQVYATFTGTATVPSFVPAVGQVIPDSIPSTIVGGTGRFRDATGTLTGTGQQKIVAVNGTTSFQTREALTQQGWISY